MIDPYELMELSPEADEAQVRRRYLELVREYPPDRAPERFAEIRAAYDTLRDPARRLQAKVLEVHSRNDSLEAIAEQLRDRLRNARFPLSLLVSWADSA
jgi:curved DNA-binding protein CbpA